MRETGKAVDAKINDARLAEIMTQGQSEDALLSICETGITPSEPTALQMRVMLHMRKRQFVEAGFVLLELLKASPDWFAHKLQGDWHYLQSQYDKAERSYFEALKSVPENPDVLHDYAVTINSQGRTGESLPYFRRACDLAPSRRDFQHHLAIIEVLGGHLKEGWERMEARMDVAGICGEFPDPQKYWRGESLEGKIIVVRTEQGIGDTVNFARYLPQFRKLGARKVYCYCQPLMLDFIREYYPDIVVWPHVAPPPEEFDYHVNTMSLPQHFIPEYFPHPERMPSGEGVGICWFGSPTHKADHLRSIPIERWEAIFDAIVGEGEKIYCLAYGRFKEKPPFIHYCIDHCWDFKQTADVMKHLRAVVTVDTAVAHIAGFLGIPTFLMLPLVPDFRWGLSGTKTPWYDSVRIYRQDRLFDWMPVIDRVARDVKLFLSEKEEKAA